ncbi:MAG: DUF222 domain-containing protein [Actinomycetota bacterium]
MEVAARARSEDLTETMDGGFSAMAAASAEVLRAVAEYDARKLWRRDGATSMTPWLAGRYGLGWGTAREWVRVARALTGLPRLARAYARGRLSWDQLRPLTRFVTPESEELWARRAPGLRPATLWREAARHRRAAAGEAQEAHRLRYLELWWDPERPVVYLQGQVGLEQGAVLEAALHRRSERVAVAGHPADPAGARLADALVELATEPKAGAAPAPTVVVHADARALTGREAPEGPWLAETESGRRLPPEAIRRLACDGRIEWVLEDGGRPVGMGRRGRAVPGALLRVLRHRDGAACRFPGCERKRWLNAHHLVHWADGAPTSLDNLVLLCGAHHRLIHEGGWRISGHPARNLRFHDPGGRAVPTRWMPHAAPRPVRARLLR